MKHRISSAIDVSTGVLLGFYMLDHIALWVLLIATMLAVVIKHEFL